jgi:hypothetical protein
MPRGGRIKGKVLKEENKENNEQKEDKNEEGWRKKEEEGKKLPLLGKILKKD